MKSEELFSILADVDENLIADANIEKPEVKVINKVEKRRSSVWRWGLVAACLCITIGVGIPALLGGGMKKEEEVFDSASTIAVENEALSDDIDAKYKNSGEKAPTTNEPYIENTNPMQPSNPVIVGDSKKETKSISRYGETVKYNGDMSVNNGCVEFSQALKDALAHYGDDVTYRVLVCVFEDGVEIPIGPTLIEGEITRFSKEGYTTIIETVSSDFGAVSTTYFTIFAKAEELNSFLTCNEYGYYVMFYDEYFGEQGIVLEEGQFFNSIDLK
ncbi:MAG: hypothetical protein Q4E99_05090 [Bacillota bacterium]|nr:hypothetical protein [Bacillota bacterium]